MSIATTVSCDSDLAKATRLGRKTTPMNQIKQLEDVIVFCDDRRRTWQTIHQAMQQSQLSYVKLPTSILIRHSWERFAACPFLIFHWESDRESQGSQLEKILEIDPNYPVGEKIIMITNEPSREDVIYFSELGLRKIVQLADNTAQAAKASKDIQRLLTATEPINSNAQQWSLLRKKVDQLPIHAQEDQLLILKNQLETLATDKDRLSARYYDISAWLAFKMAKPQLAEAYWRKAVEINPNHSKSYQGLIELFCSRKDYRKALNLIQNLQNRNKQNISRLVKMGEIYQLMADDFKAEHYFQLAIERDQDCSGALNGLAAIRFHQGNLEESRKLLEKSSVAYKLAARLNEDGIILVKQGKYEAALEHYSKAQYVLPQYQKGPMLLYNIGLCYSKWGKYQMAEQFLNLALAKEPEYPKAKKLLRQVQMKSQDQLSC